MFMRILIAVLLASTLSGCVMEAEIPGVVVRAHYGDHGYYGHRHYHRRGYRSDYPVSYHGGNYRRYSDHRDAGHEY